MLKRGLALLLALVMLTSVASAVQATTPEVSATTSPPGRRRT